MRHAACRRALLDGDLVPEVAEHLEGCDRCSAFARDLGQLSEYAQELAPPPAPDGLADRVVTHVKRAATAGASVSDLDLVREATPGRRAERLLRGPRRGPLLSSVAVAAVMLLLVGVLAALPGVRSDDDDLDPLLAAAQSTVDTGSARVRLNGTTSMTVTLPESVLAVPEVDVFEDLPEIQPPAFEPPPLSDLEGIPEEFRAQIQEDYERQFDELRAQQERFAEERLRQLDRLRADARQAFESVEIPDEFSFEMNLSGEGAVAFPDRLQITGHMEVVESEPPLPGDDGFASSFGVVVAGDATYVRRPDGHWFEVGASTGPLGPVLTDADGVGALLRGAAGDADDLGTERLGDDEVRHLRYPLTGTLLAPPDAEVEATVDVWVGVDDDVVRKLEVETAIDYAVDTGFRSRMETRLTLELFDFGAEVSVEAPDAAGRTSSPLGRAAVLDPFDPEFGTGFHFGVATIPEPPSFDPEDFEFPEFEFESEFEFPEFEFPEFEFDEDFEG